MSSQERTHLQVVETTSPTQEQIQEIMGEILEQLQQEQGVVLELEDAIQVPALVDKAEDLWQKREEQRLRDEEEARKKAEVEKRKQQEEEKRARANRQKQEAIKAAEALLQEKIAQTTPASPEAVHVTVTALANGGAVKVAGVEPAERGIEEAPEQDLVPGQLQAKYANLLPAAVFTGADWALAFRGWLAKYAGPVQRKLREDGLSDRLREKLEGMNQRFQTLFDATNQLIARGYSKDPKQDRAEFWVFLKLGEDLAKSPEFFRLTQLPREETAEERHGREQREAERKAKRQKRGELMSAIKNTLRAAGVTADDTVNYMARWLLKKAGQGGDAKVEDVFLVGAVRRQIHAEDIGHVEAGEIDKTALVYTKAAGLSADDLMELVQARRQELADRTACQQGRALCNRPLHDGASKKPPNKGHKTMRDGKKKKGGKKDGKGKGRK